MKTHSERVSELRYEKELREARLRRQHMVAVTAIFVVLIAFVVLGAAIPKFYAAVDNIHPMVQLAISLVLGGAFAFWRLRKMLGI